MADVSFGGNSPQIIQSIASTLGAGATAAASTAGAAATWAAIVAATPYILVGGAILGVVAVVADCVADNDADKTKTDNN